MISLSLKAMAFPATPLGGIWRLRRGYYSSLGRARAIFLGCFPFNDICVPSPSVPTIQIVYSWILDYFTGRSQLFPQREPITARGMGTSRLSTHGFDRHTRPVLSALSSTIRTFRMEAAPPCPVIQLTASTGRSRLRCGMFKRTRLFD